MPRQQNTTPEDYNKVLPMRLRSTMKAKGVTPAKVALLIGSTRQTVSYYQNGNRTPDAETLAKIAAALGVSADYLLGLSDTASTNEDIQAAAMLTGLSGRAIETLATIQKYNWGRVGFIRAVNYLLEDLPAGTGGQPSAPQFPFDEVTKHPFSVLDSYGTVKTTFPQNYVQTLPMGASELQVNMTDAYKTALKELFFSKIDAIYTARTQDGTDRKANK